MEQKKEKGLPIVAILAAVVLIAGICAAMIPPLKSYREQVRVQALYAEGKAVYYAAQDVIRTAQQGQKDVTLPEGTLTPDGKDTLSVQLSDELMGLVKGKYEVTLGEKELSGVYITDGKYYVQYDKDGITDMNFKLPSKQEDAEQDTAAE